VRLALGVSRLRLIGHFLTESLVLAVLGGIAALIVAGWGGRLMHALLFAGIPRSESLIDGRVLLFTALAALATGVLAGSIPAWQNSRADLTHALKSGAREGGGHHARARTTLLAVQAALSVLLVVGAGLFVKSVRNLDQLQLGVDIDRVLEGRMKLDATGQRPEDVAAIFDQMLTRVQRVRGVESAAITTWTPFGTSNGIGGRIPGNPERVSGFFGAVSPDFFRTIGARVLAGRTFTVADDRRAPMTLVVSDTLAKRYWPGENAIGKCIQLLDTLPCAQIVGVVENIKRQNIHDAHAGFVFLPIAQLPVPYTDRRILIRAAGADAAKRLIEPVRRAMQTAAPNLPYASVGTIREQTGVGGQLRPWEIGASLFTIFGVLAVLLAAVGLYGVISYSVTQRTHEMGVRIALGAQPSDVARMVVREGVLMTVAGVAIGLVVALLAGRFVGSLLFNVSPRDPLVLAIAPLVLLTIAAVASSFPAWRAMRVDPVVALKAE